MKMGKVVNNIVTLAIVGGAIYAFLNWDSLKPGSDANAQYAEQACMTEIRARFDTISANVYGITAKDSGYVVRATMKLPRGNAVKVYCLANEHGRVTDVRVDER